MLSRVLKSNVLLLLIAISSIALVAAVACEEAAEPEVPGAPQAAADPAAPQAPAGQAPGAPQAAAAPAQPKAAQAAADPEAPKAADAGPAVARKKIETRTGPTGVVLNLHDKQEITMVGPWGEVGYGNVPWRDGGGNSFFGKNVYGTLLGLNPDNQLIPWIATSWESNDDFTVWTYKLREDAVFQDGTPLTAADFKAYWEHGAKPENIVAWGGASRYIGEITGWDELMAGDVTKAAGLVALDDHTLQITLDAPLATWSTHLIAWNTGISKLEQVLAEEEWWRAPIGAGPYSMTQDPDTDRKVLTRVELAGGQWWGGDSVVDRIFMPRVPDSQVKTIMFENGEADIYTFVDEPTWAAAAADPNHYFHDKLRPIGNAGVWFTIPLLDMAPMEDLFVRKSLAQGADMQTIISAVMGPLTRKATGYISPTLPCGNPVATGHVYDPDLARQYLTESSYGSAANLGILKMDLGRSEIINMTVAMREYWKDNLDVDLDILKVESGMPRRPESQFRRASGGATFPDELTVQDIFVSRASYVVQETGDPNEFTELDALASYARSLPIGHPDRCAALNAAEEHYMDRVYIIPYHWDLIRRWAIQSWVKGFYSHLYGLAPFYDMFVEKH